MKELDTKDESSLWCCPSGYKQCR